MIVEHNDTYITFPSARRNAEPTEWWITETLPYTDIRTLRFLISMWG